MTTMKETLAQERKKLELRREDRAARQAQDLQQLTAIIAVGTSTLAGAALGINAIRMDGVKVMEVKALAFARAFEAMIEAGMPAAVAYQATASMFGVDTSASLDVISEGNEALESQLGDVMETLEVLAKESRDAGKFVKAEQEKAAAIRAAFEDDEDDGVDWVKTGAAVKHS